MRAAAIIVAAGRGLRLGGPVPKQYQALGSRTILAHTVHAALACDAVSTVVVAIHPDWREAYDASVAPVATSKLMPPVHGGAERADTVRLALEALEGSNAPDVVLIHDAARPFVPDALWQTLIEATGTAPETPMGAIAAEPVVDALWHEEPDAPADAPRADAPRPRTGLWRAQTPQSFPFAALLAAHRTAATAGGPPALDDAEVFRRADHAVRLVPGAPENFKITTAEDLARARAMLPTESRGATLMDIRMGHGFDVHRFCEGNQVTLCGVTIPHTRGLLGHSDADVGLHALADAIYGALGEGDIGTHFPPSDPQWKAAESHIFLAHAAERVRVRGGYIANVDVTLLCERPKIGPHAAPMRARVGDILGIAPDRVGLKATTMETMGFIGREEGMGCIATACVILGNAA